MSRQAAAAALVLTLAGCTQAPEAGPSPTSSGTAPSATSAPSTSTSAAPVAPAALVIPKAGKREVSRTVLTTSGDVTTLHDPVKGTEYLVTTACTAASPGATITYRILDPRPSMAHRSLEERTLMSSQTLCDGLPHVDGLGPLDHTVYADYAGTASEVTTAYTIVAPQ